MNYRMIKSILGWLLCFEATFLLLPLLTAISYGERETWIFLLCIGICLLAGGLLHIGRPKNRLLYAKDGFVIVALGWIVISLFGALPFWISGTIPSFVDALFETISGFTTTGSTILSDVEVLPRSMLMWRSFTHWVGGMGVLVFIMVFIPLGGATNLHIMRAESPGPTVSKMVPRVKQTAKILYLIYIAMTVLMFVLLLFGDMDAFDALNACFGTAGTGGFGIKNDSMASYSRYSQTVVAVFMILFSINFNAYYLLLCKKLKDAFNLEVRTFLLIVLSAVAVITANIVTLFQSFGDSLHHAFFSLASVISTTGYMTVDFNLWPSLSKAVLVVAMFIGACAGSTGGGIKVSRFVILCKGLGKELKQLLHPRQVKKITMDNRVVEHEAVRSVNVYIICYLLIFATSVLLVCLDNFDLETGFTAVAATLNNVGPGLGMVGPVGNFGFFSSFSKFVLMFDMLAGRLELFPLLLLFYPGTWKKQ